MAAILSEYLNEEGFIYDKKMPLFLNYLRFQQAISFLKGVEFLSSSNDSTSPIIYLFKVPGLSLDLKETEKILQDFNVKLLEHLDDLISTQDDLFLLHKEYINLFNAVSNQQEEYKLGRDNYFGRITIKEFPYRDLDKLKLPIVKSYYRGGFLNAELGIAAPLEYQKLGKEMKSFLSTLYKLRRKSNMLLIKELAEVKSVLFYRKNHIGVYRYKGDVADLLEVALALIETKKVYALNQDSVKPTDFCKDFCLFFNLPLPKISNHYHTITSRITERRLFLDTAKKLLKESNLA